MALNAAQEATLPTAPVRENVMWIASVLKAAPDVCAAFPGGVLAIASAFLTPVPPVSPTQGRAGRAAHPGGCASNHLAVQDCVLLTSGRAPHLAGRVSDQLRRKRERAARVR